MYKEIENRVKRVKNKIKDKAWKISSEGVVAKNENNEEKLYALSKEGMKALILTKSADGNESCTVKLERMGKRCSRTTWLCQKVRRDTS